MRATSGAIQALLPLPAKASLTYELARRKDLLAQLSILLDTNTDRDGPVKWDSVKNSRGQKHLLHSDGQGVLALCIRKTILLSLTAILGTHRGVRHGTHRLLWNKVEEVRQIPTRAFQIAGAIDAAKEEPLWNIDVVKFVSHFLQDTPSQLRLSIAFISSIRFCVRQEAEHLVSDLVTTFAEEIETLRTSLDRLSNPRG